MSDEESLLYSLAVRLIPSRASQGGGSSRQILAGQVPDDLPVPLPVPPEAQVIGSVIDGDYLKIVLDTNRTPQQVIAFYSDELSRSGWTALESGRSRGGFEQASHGHGVFRSDLGPTLHINTLAYPDVPTEVRLDLDFGGDQSGADEVARRSAGVHPIPTLPELAPPAGATLQPMGGEASPVGTSAQAELITSLDLSAVATHYAGQMRKAWCRERDRGQGNLLSWSTWEVEHPEHGPSQGLFLALQQVNDATRYFLYVRVAWTA